MKIKIKDEVREALGAGQPVVALESTIISHGLPYPDNIEIADALEQAVRQKGAIPATIAIFDGLPHIGLDAEKLTKARGIAFWWFWRIIPSRELRCLKPRG